MSEEIPPSLSSALQPDSMQGEGHDCEGIGDNDTSGPSSMSSASACAGPDAGSTPSSSSSGPNSSPGPTPTSHSTTTTPFRVLCLHDSMSNAGELSQQLYALGQRLFNDHAIELVFINSPLVASSSKATSNETTSKKEEEPVGNDNDHEDNDDNNNDNTIRDENARVWWEEVSFNAASTSSAYLRSIDDVGSDWADNDDDDGTKENQLPSETAHSMPTDDDDDTGNHSTSTSATASKRHYLGLDASLLLLRQVWTSQPFWGVLAVGQGASVAMLLALLPDMKHRPSFTIFVEGMTVLDDDEGLLLSDDGGSPMSCLHILGVKPKENTQRLVRQCGGKVSSGVQPFSNISMNRIGKFLVAQKKGLRHDPGNATILALQNQLFWVEQQAAHLVAKEIAANPPKPLMAVISPKEVGGFSGSKHRDVPGGGAPCPSEFLLQREKRTTNPNGPTRDHPSEPHGHIK